MSSRLVKIDTAKFNVALARAQKSAKEVAVDAGVDRATVFHAVSGRGVMPVTLGRIASALGVDVSELVEGENSRPQTAEWDIQVDGSVEKPFVEYNPARGVVIRASRLDAALALVNRGRELMEKYPDNTPGGRKGGNSMPYYRTCPYCGAHLDPGERCDCLEANRAWARNLIAPLTAEERLKLWEELEKNPPASAANTNGERVERIERPFLPLL